VWIKRSFIAIWWITGELLEAKEDARGKAIVADLGKRGACTERERLRSVCVCKKPCVTPPSLRLSGGREPQKTLPFYFFFEFFSIFSACNVNKGNKTSESLRLKYYALRNVK
jgi:hypothetical protein